MLGCKAFKKARPDFIFFLIFWLSTFKLWIVLRYTADHPVIDILK